MPAFLFVLFLEVPMSPVTRPARPEDAEAIRTLVRAAYARWVPVLGREPRPMQVDYAAAVLVHEFALVEAGGALVALIEMEARADHCWIENIAVTPSQQGRGLGRTLLDLADARARGYGLDEIRLLTNGKMDANRRLYAACGYEETLEEPFLDGTVVYLRKRLG